MVINPTYLAQRTAQSLSASHAKQRVLRSYREWIRSVCVPHPKLGEVMGLHGWKDTNFLSLLEANGWD